MTTTLNIDRYAVDGDGVGRREQPESQRGETAFVPYSVAGERVDVRLTEQKKNFSRWLPVRVPTPSSDRVEARCPHFFRPGITGSWCGGCDWQHLSGPAQRTAKKAILTEALIRLGGVAAPNVADTVASPEDWRYRNKVQVPFARQGKQTVAGFFAPGSHTVVPFTDCFIQPTPSVEMVHFVRDHAQAAGWHVYDEQTQRGWLRHVLIRTNRAGQALLTLVTAQPSFADKDTFVSVLRKRFPSVIGIHQNLQPEPTNVILGKQWRTLWGTERIEETILGLRLSFTASSFFQVNTGAAERLYELAINALAPDQDTTVIDVYSGVGALALLAARRAASAVGIELVEEAVRDATANAALNNIRNVRFLAGRAERLLRSDSEDLERASLGSKRSVILDPPRSGCEPELIRSLLELHPTRIVYVSCHPATLARDIKLLSPRYRLSLVTPVDLFPQTSHIEAVATLDRL